MNSYMKLQKDAEILYGEMFGHSPIPQGERQAIIVQIMLLLKQTPNMVLADKDLDTQKQIDEVIKRGRKASDKTGE